MYRTMYLFKKSYIMLCIEQDWFGTDNRTPLKIKLPFAINNNYFKKDYVPTMYWLCTLPPKTQINLNQKLKGSVRDKLIALVRNILNFFHATKDRPRVISRKLSTLY